MIINNTNNTNIKITKGDSFSFIFEIEDLTQDIESAFFTCKRNADDKAKLFQKTLRNGITKLENGKYLVRVAPSDTELIEQGQYPYDLEVGINSEVYTILKGVLMLDFDVTREVKNEG